MLTIFLQCSRKSNQLKIKMEYPAKSTIKDAGFRMSVNADNSIVERCAYAVKHAYLLHHVTEEDIETAYPTDVIGEAWVALTFLKYCQDVEFGTRTGGEKKRFDYGNHVTEEESLKAECALRLKALQASNPRKSNIDDICRVFFKTQLFN